MTKQKSLPMNFRINTSLKVGDVVKSRGDMGRFKMIVVAIHNEHFAQCKYGNSLRHWNMAFLEKVKEKP